MTEDKTEACGRCTMTTVIDTVDDGGGRNPFDGDRIEVEESEMRSAARHVVLAGRLKDRLDAWASRFAYGR
jgi:hypothetical protein